MIPIELESEDGLILIKVNAYSSTVGKRDKVEMNFFVSGSEIQYLPPGELMRGVV
jgi:hypothetical protein